MQTKRKGFWCRCCFAFGSSGLGCLSSKTHAVQYISYSYSLKCFFHKGPQASQEVLIDCLLDPYSLMKTASAAVCSIAAAAMWSGKWPAGVFGWFALHLAAGLTPAIGPFGPALIRDLFIWFNTLIGVNSMLKIQIVHPPFLWQLDDCSVICFWTEIWHFGEDLYCCCYSL